MHKDRQGYFSVTIEGVSLVANYRAQFNKIIRASSYEALVARLKSRQAEFSGALGGFGRHQS